MCNIKLVATDLDGTLLKNDKSISSIDLNTIIELGDKGIKRVIATGRNFKKVRAVVSPQIPFDFIIYSSGAGIYDCTTQKHVYSKNISKKTSKNIADYLLKNDISFNAFHAVPENHQLWYYRGAEAVKEFDDYFQFHNSHAIPFPEIDNFDCDLCQFLIILPNDKDLFCKYKEEILARFDEVGIVRTTSPLHSGNIWMEVFHKSVSKGNAVAWLCNSLEIQQKQTFGIGNDYNDIELLNYTNYSYLTANGPKDLKSNYKSAPSNEEDAFTVAIGQHVS